MAESHEEEKDEDQLLDLRKSFLSCSSKSIYKEVDWIERVVEMEQSEQFEVLGDDGFVNNDEEVDSDNDNQIWDHERASEISPNCIFKGDNFASKVYLIHIDKEGDHPEWIDEHIEGDPIDIQVIVIVERIVKDNS